MFDLKTDEFKACRELEIARKLRWSVKISDIYGDLKDRDEIVNSLEKLTSYLFDKIES